MVSIVTLHRTPSSFFLHRCLPSFSCLFTYNMSPSQTQPQLHQAYFISITDNGPQSFGQELYLTTFGPGFPSPIGAGQFGAARWLQLDPGDPFTYSLVTNSEQLLEPFRSPPITGQFLYLEHVVVGAGASLTINLVFQGAQPNQAKKLIFGGLTKGKTLTAGSKTSTTPL